MQIVYKKFSKRNGVLRSWSPPNGCSFEYQKRKWNKPSIPNSKFFVFDTVQDAIRYDGNAGEVWACAATGVATINSRLQIFGGSSNTKKFWNGGKIDEELLSTGKHYTVCDELFLLRKVWESQND